MVGAAGYRAGSDVLVFEAVVVVIVIAVILVVLVIVVVISVIPVVAVIVQIAPVITVVVEVGWGSGRGSWLGASSAPAVPKATTAAARTPLRRRRVVVAVLEVGVECMRCPFPVPAPGAGRCCVLWCCGVTFAVMIQYGDRS